MFCKFYCTIICWSECTSNLPLRENFDAAKYQPDTKRITGWKFIQRVFIIIQNKKGELDQEEEMKSRLISEVKITMVTS